MAEDKWMMDRGSEAMEGSATVVLGLELCNGTCDDDGIGNFHAASPLENVQWTCLYLRAEGQEENSEEECVEAVREEGYRQVENASVILPSTLLAGGSGTVTRPSDNLPQSCDSSSCSTPTDDPQVTDGMLEVPFKRMMSYIQSISETDEETSIKRHRGEFQNQKVKIKEYPETHKRVFLKVRDMAYLRYTFILPVLGYTTSSRLVMLPQMVQGDLAKVCAKLGWKKRCQISYQLSAGLAFLHSSIPGFREEIWHGNIKAENIYLDQNLNARIGDFSKAIELRKKSASPSDVAKDDAKRKEPLKEDIYSFARVELFLLKSTDATDFLPELPEANKMVSCEKYWDMEIWKYVPRRIRKDMASLIVRCARKSVTAEHLEINLKRLLVSYAIPSYNLPEGRSNYCIYCCVNIQDNNPVPVPSSELCPDACPLRRFCRTCYQTSYRNTLYCPDHGPLKDKIPKNDVYAILLSGFEKDKLKQDILDRDVESMFNVITDPRIMGLSDGNIFQISHNSPDKLKALHDAVKYLKTKTVHTLIFYYSGHGSKGKYKGVDEDDDEDDEDDKKDDNDEDDSKDNVPFFLLGEKRTGITDKNLRKILTPFTKTNLLVIMDCCFAARYKVLPEIRDKEPRPEIYRVQFNGTGSTNFGQMSSRINSIFTCCLLSAMEGGFRCPPFLCDVSKCKEGVYFQRSAAASGYISLDDCLKFITQHIENYDVDSNLVKTGLLDDVAIARYHDTPLGVFKYDIRGVKGILNLYKLQDIPDDLLWQLWDEIGSVYGLSSGRHQLLKNLDFRCLMMVVPGIHAEREIQKKRQVICECSRGHVIQIRIRSTSQDLDQDRRVVCFYCDHNRFKEVLDKVQVCYKDFFMYVFEKPENIEAAVIDIRIAEDPGLSQLQSAYCDYERKNFIGLIVTSLTRAYEMARSNQDIRGLRVRITANLATLELEMKTLNG